MQETVKRRVTPGGTWLPNIPPFAMPLLRDDDISFNLDERAAALFPGCPVPCLLLPEIPTVDNYDCCVVGEGQDSGDRLLDPEHKPDAEGLERACHFSNPFQHEAEVTEVGFGIGLPEPEIHDEREMQPIGPFTCVYECRVVHGQ
jgi:hypothetical protein